MFWITKKQFNEIADMIKTHCCNCSPYYCSEAKACDVTDILEVLEKHVEREFTEEEELPFELEEEDGLL